jgi:dTDP-4-dehydrorhamnose reductase
MKVLITGAGGQLGREMQEACRKRGMEVLALDSNMLDITDFSAVKKAFAEFSPGWVINCAAYNAVDQAETEWKRAYSVNGYGPKHLALAAAEHGAVLVHYSTDYVFDGKKASPYTIADPPHPLSRYGTSKLLGEHMVLHHCSRHYVIRTSWVFGKGKENFAEKVLAWSRTKDQLRIVDDQISTPTFSVDLADTTLDLLETGLYGLHHVTNSGACSRYRWAQKILELDGWEGTLLPAKTREFPTPAERPLYSVLDNFGTEEVLDHPMPSWEDAVVRYYRHRGDQ